MNKLVAIHFIGFLLSGIIQDYDMKNPNRSELYRHGSGRDECLARNLELPNPPRHYGFNLTSWGSKRVPRM